MSFNSLRRGNKNGCPLTPFPVYSLHYSLEAQSLANVQQNVLSDVTFQSETFGAGDSNMQVSSRVHQTVKTGESVEVTKLKNRGPCPGCKQYLPQLKLGPFIKHRHHCKGDIGQRDVSCLPPDRNTNKSVSKKKSCPALYQIIWANWPSKSTFADLRGYEGL